MQIAVTTMRTRAGIETAGPGGTLPGWGDGVLIVDI